MLSKKDKEEILRLRQEEDLSYESIHDKTGSSVNTIMGICREKVEEEKGEVEDIQKEKKVHFDDPIDKIRAMPDAIDKFIETEGLKGANRAEWEKRREEIREIIRVEVDGRIVGEREDAVDKRDDEWRDLIIKKYVEKDVVTNLRRVLKETDDNIKSRDSTINGLKETNDERNTAIGNLHEANQNLLDRKIAVEEINGELNYYIGMELDDAGRRERGLLSVERTNFNTYVERERQAGETLKELLDKRKEEQDGREEGQEGREKKLDEMQEKILEDIKENKNLLNKCEILKTRTDNTLKEIKKEMGYLDIRQKAVERVESVRSREIKVGQREKSVEEKEEKFKEIKKPKMMEKSFTMPIQKVKLPNI